MIKTKILLAAAVLSLPLPIIGSWLAHNYLGEASYEQLQRRSCHQQKADLCERRSCQIRKGVCKQLVAASQNEKRRLLQLESPQSTLYLVEEAGLCEWIEEFDQVKVTELFLQPQEKKNLLLANKLFHHYNSGLLRAEALSFRFNLSGKEGPLIEGKALRGSFTLDKGLANGMLEKPSAVYKTNQL